MVGADDDDCDEYDKWLEMAEDNQPMPLIESSEVGEG